MNDTTQSFFWMAAIVVSLMLALFFVLVMPSLIGLLIGVILLFLVFDIAARRRRVAARTFNSAVRAVCHHPGAVGKVAVAFSRSGPLSGPCYEFARRMTLGEHPVDAAAISRVPLQLATAVALESPSTATNEPKHRDPSAYELRIRDNSGMPAYAQLLYLTLTACITCLVLTFTGIFVVPTIERMFDEFGLQLPYAILVNGAPAMWIIGAVVAVIMIMVPILTSERILGLSVSRWLPQMPRIAERRAETLHGIADAVDAGWPIGRALAVGHTISLRNDERASLEYAMQLIQRGQSPTEAMRRAGWIDRQEEAWLSGASPQRTAELMRVIADQNIRDARSNLRWLMAVFFPLVILLLGTAVLTFSYGFLGTLMELVSGLAS